MVIIMSINQPLKATQKIPPDCLILRPSTISGIGVFTLRDIPKGSMVFSGREPYFVKKLNEIPQGFRHFCIFLENGMCLAPRKLNHIETHWYTNHSFQPNLTILDNEDEIAIRHIKAGEEILLDYNELNEPEELKEYYYKK